MRDAWQTLWDAPGTTWSELYTAAPPALRFHLPDYYVSRPLCAAAERSGHVVLGRNEEGLCISFDPEPSTQPVYECLNDGQCAPSTAAWRASTYPDSLASSAATRCGAASRTWS